MAIFLLNLHWQRLFQGVPWGAFTRHRDKLDLFAIVLQGQCKLLYAHAGILFGEFTSLFLLCAHTTLTDVDAGRSSERLGGAWGWGWEEPGDEAGRGLGMGLGGAWGWGWEEPGDGAGRSLGMGLGGAWGWGWEEPGDGAGRSLGMRLGGAWGWGWEEPGDKAWRSMGMRLGVAWGCPATLWY